MRSMLMVKILWRTGRICEQCSAEDGDVAARAGVIELIVYVYVISNGGR
jgi:hypothetical protein